MKRMIFAAAIILFSAQFAAAQTPNITHRQITQQQRIRQGVRSGQLTRNETRHLERREAKIRHDKRVAKSDGVVTNQERRHLNREEDRTSRAIYNKKHNLAVR